ncbi:MAG: cobyric acid synthase [Alphaproteobacteria bacterium]
MAKALMVMGTASNVGKTVIAAGLCRLCRRRDISVVPFKAQNMSLNSFVTPEGGEMGRAQVLQAEACGLMPHVDMNPILLKPEADNCSQVIIHGKVWGKHDAQNYFSRRSELLCFVQESYQRLAHRYDLVVIEGAGSAAEINLRDRDIVNWPVAQMADARVILVADIDRGGVFAQIIGTLDLLTDDERRRVIGVLINKFRGDLSFFNDGVTYLEERTRLPILGVIPFQRNLELDQEDSVEIERHQKPFVTGDKVNVAVVLLPHMSNFTDFNALVAESDVALRYVKSPSEITGADVAVLPGSKSVMADLDYLHEAGFGSALQMHARGGGELVGICGGFQMLGREISDPYGVETGGKIDGLGFLDVFTDLTPEKRTVQVEARPLLPGTFEDCAVQGYEIHMGRTKGGKALPSFWILSHPDLPKSEPMADGAISDNGHTWGTYIHGVFDNHTFRRHWLNQIRQRKGLAALPTAVSESVNQRLSSAMDRWADHLERHLNLPAIFADLKLPCDRQQLEIRL